MTEVVSTVLPKAQFSGPSEKIDLSHWITKQSNIFQVQLAWLGEFFFFWRDVLFFKADTFLQ